MRQKKHQPNGQSQYPLIIKMLLGLPKQSPNNEIIYRDKARFSYAGLHERISRLANGLRDLGVSQGDVVAVIEYDSHRYLECYFAVPMTGAVLQPVNYTLSSKQIANAINRGKPNAIIVNSEFLGMIKAIRKNLKTVQKIIAISEGDECNELVRSFDAEYEELLTKSNPTYNFPDLDENTKAISIYVAGLTGRYDNVIFTHKQIFEYAHIGLRMQAAFDNMNRSKSSDEVYMPLTPLFYARHTCGFPYVPTLLGMQQIYPGKFDAQRILKLIVKEKVTLSHSMPSVLRMLVLHPLARNVDLSRWNVIMGVCISRDLAEAARKLKITVQSGTDLVDPYPLARSAHATDRPFSAPQKPARPLNYGQSY